MRAALHQLRFRLWAARLRARLRRHGARLVVEAPHPVRWFTPPHVEVAGAEGGTLTLRVGEGVHLGRGLVLDIRTGAGSDNLLDLADGVAFQRAVRLQLHGGSIALGEHVQLRDFVLLKTKSTLHIGPHTVVSLGAIVHATAGVTIGRFCGIGERSSVIDSDHTYPGAAEPRFLDLPLKLGPIVVGDNVGLSVNCVVLRGSTIGDGTVVAAGSVVVGADLPAGQLVAGAPARVLHPLREG